MPESTKQPTLEPEELILESLERAIVDAGGGTERLRANLAALFRQALDEVIDTPRSRRRLLSEIEKTEKTYIGTKVEILFRNLLNLPKGERLDLRIGDRDVDVKFTIHNNWTIPNEAVNELCLLLSCSEDKATFSAGLIAARPEYLNEGKNRDLKRTISLLGRNHIRWIFRNEAYPANFWAAITPADANYITEMNVSGTERIRRLFMTLAGRPVPRRIVESVAQQKDFMKRIRKNGGARDLLQRDGYRLLSSARDSAEIKSRGLPACASDEFICVKE